MESTDPLRIVIVDDSPEDRMIYRRFLSQHPNDYEIQEADTGAAGLECCRTHEPDCVLLDYSLPDLDGLEFLGELTSAIGIKHSAVVMLTGQGNEAVAVEAMKKGAQDYLVKGEMNAARLQQTISNAIEKKSLMWAVEEQRRELERSNRELEQFAYLASHDLQAPLRRTQGFCQLLQRRYEGKLDSDADEFIGCIVESTKHMQALVSGLLQYSRVGTQENPFEPTDFSTVVQRASANLQVAISEIGAKVTCDTLPTVPADSVQMIQLLQNLIANGIKFRGDRAPEVHVSAEAQAESVRFCVRDNGIGIDPKHHEDIFQIFKRLHGDAEYSGTGIGLATCKKIVDRHGGRIWVESQPGQGSAFYFTVPTRAEGPDDTEKTET